MDIVLILIIAVSVVIVSLIVYGLIARHKHDKNIRAMVKEQLDGRIWTIPITLQCQTCKSDMPVDFHLGMYAYKCQHCKESNKIFINFITTLDDDE